ncbi:hypothetical protein E1287_37705 [Actinomadura sp. KC06]|uniref:hypothetical protein n=1 Tax=Actinomadura sp. KC06 TaxID=2530369 RepID=UPI001042EB77|nr:hypothetical protein [Actinomadura sp. KC06]TDD24999.1 hypothetical protein E1287_37705 [Actinomadura sp. KC06]
MSKPSVGRIVHYVSYGTPGGEYTPQCRAAIITEVPHVDEARTPELHAEGEELQARGRVGLALLNPSGMFFNEADYDEQHHGGTWHWPERV